MKKQLVVIIDYGMGNLHSVEKAAALVAPQNHIEVTGDHRRIAEADRLIFPGVGAIKDCMAAINDQSLGDLLRRQVQQKPMLGICVGMQALMAHSDENQGVDCLSFFEAKVQCFSDQKEVVDQRLKVPHMGWNTVQQASHRLWDNIETDSRFYFVHSYYVPPNLFKQEQQLGISHYGVDLTAAVIKHNILAVQFHPEKSDKNGLQLLGNFMQWDGDS